MSRTTALLVVLALTASGPAPRAQARVPTDVAMNQLIKRVEPVAPAEAIAQKVGGPVVADIIVSPKGTVESVTILAGPPMLHPAATAAFKQWVFKPFTRNGKPVPALVLVEVAFPDPIADARKAAVAVSAYAYKAYQGALNACERDLESSPKTADRACGELVRVATQHADLRRMLPTAHGIYGRSLLNQNRTQEAVAEFERARSLVVEIEGPGSFETAAAHGIVGMLQEDLRDFAKADESFTQSVKSYDAAMQARPKDVAARTENIRLILQRAAALKRRLGQEAAARALEAKIVTLPAAPPPEAALEPEPPPAKLVGSIPCFGSLGIQLTEDDVRQIRAELPAGAQPWFIVSKRKWPGAVEGVDVEVYLQPDVSTPELRRGRIVWVMGKLQRPDAFDAKTTWRTFGLGPFEYVQVPPTGSDPAGVWTPMATRPIRVASFDPARPFTNVEIQALVKFVRSTAARTPSAGTPPRLFSDLQPWIITELTRDPDGSVQLWLVNPDSSGPRGQNAVLKPSGSTWTIAQLSGR